MTDYPTEQNHNSWSASIAFWCCLFISAVLFASVALAPKLHDYLTLHDQYYRNQVRMVLLEQQVKYLQKVSNALENDPDFAAELARLDFAAAHPDEEQIPVETTLGMDSRPAPRMPEQDQQQAFTTAIINQLAHRHSLRKAILITAACLVVFAFGFLHDAHSSRLNRLLSTCIQSSKQLWSRYQS